MKVFALDSSGPVVTLGLADGRKILAESQFTAGSKTVGFLTPEIERILTESGVHPRDLDGFALGAGPGSFTGLKVGYAAVMGLAFDGEKPIWTFPSLRLTALGLALSAEFKKGLSIAGSKEKQPVFQPDSGGMHLDFGQGSPSDAKEKETSIDASDASRNKVLVLTSAKKGYFYRRVFVWTENRVEEAEPLLAQKIEELVWPGEPVWVTGSALETKRAEIMGHVRPEDRAAAKDFWHPPVGILAQLAATGKLGEPVGREAVLEPIFLKSFETKFKEII
ncbi:MAG TPA: tRNA (adenosine(37)-N6)-threonylcarbamoyltransferase complex dimerization subunit type 1 TsaB [candidate division Zixibacteria bacterium]|nr:tRNA (adenosine(37)-N6)-threonylcarbamoyltransferase complex dimerization subunit type 1 TsaB [candidate division Zixibacteria bacterium]